MTPARKNLLPRATEEEILAALHKDVPGRKKPRSKMEIARSIHMSKGGAHWDKPKLSIDALDALLAQMAREGKVITQAGGGWHGLSPSTHGLNKNGSYHALPGQVKEWEQAAAERAEERTLAIAKDWASRELTRKYSEEHVELVTTFLTASPEVRTEWRTAQMRADRKTA